MYVFKKNESTIYAIAVGRKITVDGANVLRLTEMFTDLDYSSAAGGSLNVLMERNEYEYIDFLEYGFAPESLIEMGF